VNIGFRFERYPVNLYVVMFINIVFYASMGRFQLESK
jgi:hypothetical protein